jgi:hypothetical protein
MHRPCGMSRACGTWGVPRANVHRHRPGDPDAANPVRTPKRRGPTGACSDAGLLTHIKAAIAASPFCGGGCREVWARLRLRGVRTAARRLRRITKKNSLPAPQRPVRRDAHPHTGTIVADRVDEVWRHDRTQTVTLREGRACVFIAVDHCPGESVVPHAASRARRWEALEPIRQGATLVMPAQTWPGA